MPFHLQVSSLPPRGHSLHFCPHLLPLAECFSRVRLCLKGVPIRQVKAIRWKSPAPGGGAFPKVASSRPLGESLRLPAAVRFLGWPAVARCGCGCFYCCCCCCEWVRVGESGWEWEWVRVSQWVSEWRVSAHLRLISDFAGVNLFLLSSSAVFTKLFQSLNTSHQLWQPLHFTIRLSQFVCTTPAFLLFFLSWFLGSRAFAHVDLCSLHSGFTCVRIFFIIFSVSLFLSLSNIFSLQLQIRFKTRYSMFSPPLSTHLCLVFLIWLALKHSKLISWWAHLLQLMRSKFLLSQPCRAYQPFPCYSSSFHFSEESCIVPLLGTVLCFLPSAIPMFL